MTDDKEMKDSTVQEKSETSATTAPPLPPLEAAARRLDRQLGGGAVDKHKVLHTYANPAKVVRRWLGTASGAAGSATVADIAEAAGVLFDPNGACSTGRALLLAPGGTTMELDTTPKESPQFLTSASSREVESWLLSLSIRILWKEKNFSEALDLAQKSISILLGHLEVASMNLTSLSGVSTSSLFPLLARLYRYRSLLAEELKDVGVTATIRRDMTIAHNMACLRRDVDCQATLLNLMLRDLLIHSQIEQAQKLLSNSTFPDSASNNQLCRYLYYSGRIQALRLEYTKAFSNLSQCLRKAPTNTGLGFRITAQRLAIVVQLLMGEIPERHVFFSKGMKTELSPYLAITQAVRRGDLAVFNKVVSEQASQLQQDETFTLISRLAHQVVKAGLRKLHVSYSRLSLQDVADRLGLPSATSAEFVVAKAVRDGVLDATIHHEEGYVQSHDLVDVYATKEPTEAFHRRIAYCLTTHNDAIRGMRYPPDAYKQQLEASRGNRRKRSEDKTDEEKAQELEDELDDEY
mmetsp:Transcript_89535/g.175242  ORF Transcript_89535/g.175242 Transcript_89535/m.175242 type:complete len:521 (+) Transcript_89535:68-1630(+)